MYQATNMQSNTASTTRVSKTMSAPDIIAVLSRHRCLDITDRLDLDQCGQFPVSGGGSGDVYQGVLGRKKVAIKCARLHLRQDDESGRKVLKHAARELYIWSGLKHNNVMELLGLVQFRGQMAMVSPWMSNGTLLEYIDRNPQANRHRLCVDISEGVAYLHDKNIIHGDIKSGNVLISDEGVAKMADFGCTELKLSTLSFTTTTSTSMFSMRWAAPEILEGSVERSKMADVYALGMTLLEVVTGTIPFSNKSDAAVYRIVALQHLMPDRPDNFSSFNPSEAKELWIIMVKSWTHHPPDRPTSAVIKNLIQNIRLLKTFADVTDPMGRWTRLWAAIGLRWLWTTEEHHGTDPRVTCMGTATLLHHYPPSDSPHNTPSLDASNAAPQEGGNARSAERPATQNQRSPPLIRPSWSQTARPYSHAHPSPGPIYEYVRHTHARHNIVPQSTIWDDALRVSSDRQVNHLLGDPGSCTCDQCIGPFT